MSSVEHIHNTHTLPSVTSSQRILLNEASVDIEIALSFVTLFAPHNRDMQSLAAENAVATWLHDHGRLLDAERVYRRVASTLRHSKHNGGAKQRAAVLFNLGVVLEGQGRFVEAEACVRDSITLSQKLTHPDQAALFTSTRRLAGILQAQGKWDDAANVLRRLITDLKIALGESHQATLHVAHGLADLLTQMGKQSEARVLFEETLALKQRSLGMQHPSTLATREALAELLGDMQCYGEAIALLRSIITTRRGLFGDADQATLRLQNNLGHFLQCTGAYHEAESYLRNALRVQQETLGAQHDDTLRSMTNLATVLAKLGMLHEAEQLFRDTLAARRDTDGDPHCETLVARNNLAAFLIEQHALIRAGDATDVVLREAASILEEGLGYAEMLLPQGRLYMAHLESWYGRCLTLLNRREHAEIYAIRGYLGFGETLGYDHQRTHKALVVLTDLYKSELVR